MNVSSRLLLFILSLILAIFSSVLALLPFNKFSFFIEKNIWFIIEFARGNYIYLLIGLILFCLSIWLFYKSIKRDRKKHNEYYINKITEYGEIKISAETVEGLVQHVSNKFSTLHNIKIKVDMVDGQIYINLIGEVTPDINIPDITSKLQEKTKNHVESCTGLKVAEIKVYISKVSTPMRNIK